MKRVITLIISLLFIATILSAQDLQVQQYYRLTTEEAKELMMAKEFEPGEEYFHTLYQSISSSSDSLSLAAGNYISVGNIGNQVALELITETTIEPKIWNSNQYIFIRLEDTSGVEVKPREVLLNKKIIPYDEATQSFKIAKKKRLKKFDLLVVMNQEVVAYHFQQNEYGVYKPNRRSFWYKVNPINWVAKIGEWIGGLFAKKRTRYDGYMVLNQPKYRPGDTLKVKGYFVNGQKEQLTKPLTLRLSSYGQKKQDWKITPTAAGSYLSEIVLADSLELELDKRYTLSFKGEKGKVVFSKSFKYEDYLLDEAEYKLIVNHEPYPLKVEYGDSVLVTTTGKMKSGLDIFDSKVDLVLMSHGLNYLKPDDFFADTVLIRDTLWKATIAVNSDTIKIPSAVFPKAATSYRLQGVFVNANGEIQTKSIRLTIVKSIEEATVLEPKKKINKTKLYVIAKGEHQGDSVFVRLENPDRRKVIYEWYEDDVLIENNHTTVDGLLFSLPAKRESVYRFHYYYVNGNGRNSDSRIALIYHINKLNIEADLPPEIIPGESVTVKLNVKDIDGNPAPHVNLVATGRNAKFGHQDISRPRMASRNIKSLPVFKNYKHQEKERRQSKKINQDWLEKLNVKDDAFYQTRFLKDGLFTRTLKISKDSFIKTKHSLHLLLLIIKTWNQSFISWPIVS